MATKILVVDDEQSLRELVKFRLEFKGYEVITADNGATALQMVAAESPDLIVLDIMMPDMTGLEVLAQIRKEEKYHDMKVLLLSAKGREQDQEAGLSAGANAYLTKPFRAQHLLEKVQELLQV